MTAFDQAFAFVLGHEGGFDMTAADPGNWTGGAVGKGTLKGTNWGISAAAFPGMDIEHLTQDDAKVIYKKQYWDAVRGDELHPPLALLCFDAAVNNGVGRAARWLQIAAGTKPDGLIGPATMAAIAAMTAHAGAAGLCAEFQAQRLSFMAGLSTWRTFGLGWARRLCQLPYQSLMMTEA